MKHTVYLVTGAAGNLGSSIARQLVGRGKKVRGLALKGDPAAGRLPQEIDLVYGDVTDPSSLSPFFDLPPDTGAIVIHCASIVTVNPDYSEKVQNVNVAGTKNILDKCLETGVKKLVFISSTGAIPEPPKGTPVTEVGEFPPSAVTGFYGKTKAEATNLVMKAVGEKGLDASIVFPTGICGPGDYAYGPVASFIIDYVNGGIPVGIDGSFNAVDVRDLAEGVIACCEKGRRGEGYIMGNGRVSMKEMIHLICQACGAREIRTFLPIGLARALAGLSGGVSRITGKRAKMTPYAVYNLARNNDFCSDKAAGELGFAVRPFAETIADTVAWLKAEGKI